MAICGICKQDESIEHVREHFKSFYAAKQTALATPEVTGFAKSYVESKDFKPMATAPVTHEVPDSNYALKDDAGYHFYRVRHGKAGTKWEKFAFVDHLIGHPGDFLPRPVKGGSRQAVLNLLAQDPKGAAKLFADEAHACAVCGSALSDQESLERGLGPVCAKRFG